MVQVHYVIRMGGNKFHSLVTTQGQIFLFYLLGRLSEPTTGRIKLMPFSKWSYEL